MSFSDVFKSSFLEKVSSVSPLDMVMALALAFALGLFIYFVYKKTFSGVMYSASFGVSLVALSMITTLVILAVTSNVVLSLGMVGALSIVRFRTAIKEPMDIAFLFWAIAGGIVLGAGLLPLAILGSVFIGIILLIFANRKGGDTPYILVLNCADASSADAGLSYVKEHTKKQLLKSKSISAGGVEVTSEVRLKDAESKFVSELSAMEGVNHAVLVSYNGEYMS